MGGGVQVEKPVKRPLRLTALLWCYLLSTGGILLVTLLLWWLCFAMLVNLGFVLPAAYAAGQVQSTAEVLSREFDTEVIPHYYRWAVFDADGDLKDSGGMDRRHADYARQAIDGEKMGHFPYYQHHQMVSLPEGAVCVLQYDYSNPYADPALEKVLPDFLGSMLALLAGMWGLLAGLNTRRYTRLLRQDAKTITAATQAIAHQRLNERFTGGARVRELGEALEAMDLLRESLADSLERQWAMEQQSRRELAALTHDLKTPLTIISGNGELLAEEALSAAQQGSVDAILRGAERLEDYLGRLRALSAGDGGEEPVQPASLLALFQLWRTAGEGLCGPKDIQFQAEEPPALLLPLRQEAANRAVLNLLDNAVRYAGSGGKVGLSVRAEGEHLTVSVTDTGPGFTPEALARAGRGLYTSDASRPQDGHTGWGLCYARQVAKDHGGELRLFNTEQGGTAELLFPLGE